jgi:histidinol-phosphatase
MNHDWTRRYEQGIRAAQDASKLALRYFDTGVAVETKADQSPVTIADRAAEELIRSRLRSLFPADGFLGEEFGDEPGSSGYRWIIDPIDGTRSFIRGIPIWATLLGLEFEGELIAGVACNPVWNQTHRALKGNGAYRDDRPIRVSTQTSLKAALFAYSSHGFFRAAGREDAYLRMLQQTDRSRGYCDYYGFVLVAQGSVDFMIDHGVHAWDIAGLKLIVEEAGGRFTDWDGGDSIERPDVVASNGLLHDHVRAILNPPPV